MTRQMPLHIRSRLMQVNTTEPSVIEQELRYSFSADSNTPTGQFSNKPLMNPHFNKDPTPTQDIKHIIKEYIKTNTHYGPFSSSSDGGDLYDAEHLYIKLSQTLQTEFRDTLAFDLTRVTSILEDIEDKEEQYLHKIT